MQQSSLKVLARVASLKLTSAGIAALLVGVLVTYFGSEASWLWLIVPLVLLALNLASAMCVNPRLYRRPGLFVFHLGLLGVVLLVTYGRLTSFHGRIELTETQQFSAESVEILQAGPWHSTHALKEIAFTQGRINVDYARDIVRLQTRSRVRSPGAQPETVGDNDPYRAGGYEFYTTSNKGFAALMTWFSPMGEVVRGTVHFPSYPLNEWNQINNWQPPGSDVLRLELRGLPMLHGVPRFSLNEHAASGVTLHLPDGQQLVPGEATTIGRGRLQLDGIHLWMGYEVRQQPLSAPTFAAAALGILGMAWHLLGMGGVRARARRGPRDTVTLRGLTNG